MVDVEDYERLNQYRWGLTRQGYVIRRATVAPYLQRQIRMHRELLGLERGDPRQGDHINRDKLDHRRCNLRVGTQAENGQNVPGGRGKSKYRGVAWNKREQKWKASARLNGHLHNLGTFSSERDAADAAAQFREHHMPFSEEAGQ